MSSHLPTPVRVGAAPDGELGPDGEPHRGRPDPGELAAFGTALRRAREVRGWSTETLAARAGVSRRFARDLEAGTRRPRQGTVRALAVALAPTAPGPLADGLLSLAGGAVQPDTHRSLRRRRRARRARLRDLPPEAVGTVLAWRRADRLTGSALRLAERSDSTADRDRARRLLAEADALRKEQAQ